MPKNKIAHFAELETFSNVYQPYWKHNSEQRHELAGMWGSIFENDNPIVLELGCGKGEYTTGMARIMPQGNYIGVDVKGARIWRGAKDAIEENLNNVRFLRTRIDFIHGYFAPNEVSEIWLTFSDPQPLKPNKRLTSEVFIERYRKILKPNGIINLKCDSTILYEYTLEQIQEHGYEMLQKSDDVYGELVNRVDPIFKQALEIRTFYESRWLKEGKKIKFVSFRI